MCQHPGRMLAARWLEHISANASRRGLIVALKSLTHRVRNDQNGFGFAFFLDQYRQDFRRPVSLALALNLWMSLGLS